jgi:hypothetical protein
MPPITCRHRPKSKRWREATDAKSGQLWRERESVAALGSASSASVIREMSLSQLLRVSQGAPNNFSVSNIAALLARNVPFREANPYLKYPLSNFVCGRSKR